LGNLPNDAGTNIRDIAAIIAYTVEDCVDACSAITFQTMIQGYETGPTCSSVSWFADAKSVVGIGNGNCWLKSGTPAVGESGKAASNAVSVLLI
jgi:hypothetical protein